MDTIPAVSSSEDHLKAAFAAAMLRHPATLDGRFAAAQEITGDIGKALFIANKWPDDPFVVAEQARLLGPTDDDPLNIIFTKQDLTRELWTRMQATRDNEVFAKLLDQALKLRGWVSKPTTEVNVQVNQNKVMIVRDMGSDADWEAKAAKQQRALIDVSASKH